MKKILILLLLSFITFSIFSNEIITDIKYKFDDGRKFYPIDEEGNMDYGFYKYNIYEELIPPKDETIEPFNGKVDFNLIKKLAKYHKEMRWGGLGVGLGMGSGVAFLASGAGYTYYVLNVLGYNPDSLSSVLKLSIGITLLVGGVVEFILGCIAIGITAYHGYNYKKTKKEIIDLLNNNSDVTSIKTDKIKIRFCFNIDINNISYKYF